MLKKLSIAALILIGVGLAGAATTFGSANKNSSSFVKKIDTSEPIVSVMLKSPGLDIVIKTVTDPADAKVELKQTRNIVADVTQEDGELTIQVPKPKQKWIQINPFSVSEKLVLYLPESSLKSITAVGEKSDILVTGIKADHLEVTSLEGDILLENLQSSDISIRTKNGDIGLNQVKSNTLTSLTEQGDLSGRHIEGALELEASSGDITVKLKDIHQPIKGKTKNGDILILTDKVPDRVSFTANTLYGDIIIFGKKQLTQLVDNPILVDLETKSGDIIVKSR